MLSILRFAPALLLAAAATAQDPVMETIVRADSLATADGDVALGAFVRAHPERIGAAIGQLVEIGLQLGDAGDLENEQGNLDFADMLAAAHDPGDDRAAFREYLGQARSWDAAARAERQRAQELEAAAKAAQGEGELDRAVAGFHEAREIYEALGDLRSLAVLYGSLGVAHWYRADWPAVEESYTEALRRRRALDDRILEGRTLNGLGSLHFAVGDPQTALGWYRQAAELRRSTGDLAGLGTSLGYAANCHRALGQAEEARQLYDQALPVLERLGEGRKVAETLNGIANLHEQQGQLREAEDVQRQAIARARTDAVDHLSLFHLDLATTLRRQGRPTEALEEIAASRAALEATPNPALHWLLDRVSGECARALGDRDGARQHLVASVRAARELGDAPSLGDALVNLAALYVDFEAADRAIEVADEALELARQNADVQRERDALNVLGNARMAMGENDAAIERFHAAVVIDREHQLLAALADDEAQLGSALSRAGREEEARQHLRASLRRFVVSDRAPERWTALLAMGDSFEGSDPDSASHWYGRAMELLESSRASAGAMQSGYFSTQRGASLEGILHYYAKLQQGGAGDRWMEAAFAVAERSRAAGLRDLVELARATEDDSARASIPTLQAALSAGDLYLEYAVTDSASYLFAIDRERASLHALPPRAVLASSVRRLHDALAQPGVQDAELRSLAVRLYAELLSPIAERLRSADRLVVAPDDVLHELPFELLLPSDDGSELGELPWLTQELEIAYVPSASLALLDVPQAPGRGVLAFGGPSYPALPPRSSRKLQALEELPFARGEVERLRRHFPRGELSIQTGPAASETALRTALAEQRPRILHLATHGLVDARQPELSCLAFAPGVEGEDDGYLYATEILGLHLSADLVVLSACESGRGRIDRGEGVIGLTRSFLASGAHSVVASLWPVSDESTAKLMDAFYAAYAEDGDAAKALRSARSQLLRKKETAHPFHWAAFVPMGRLSS